MADLLVAHVNIWHIIIAVIGEPGARLFVVMRLAASATSAAISATWVVASLRGTSVVNSSVASRVTASIATPIASISTPISSVSTPVTSVAPAISSVVASVSASSVMG